MTKKEYLELLIESFGLIPVDIEHYRTNGNGGEYEVGIGWRGRGIDNNGDTIIMFAEPDGFKMAVYEILRQGIEEKCRVMYVKNK